MHRLSWYSLVLPLLAPAAAQDWDGYQQPLTGTFNQAACPDYASYAAFPQ
jgi:hypothetical protein